jgi:hypothetical protein
VDILKPRPIIHISLCDSVSKPALSTQKPQFFKRKSPHFNQSIDDESKGQGFFFGLQLTEYKKPHNLKSTATSANSNHQPIG